VEKSQVREKRKPPSARTYLAVLLLFAGATGLAGELLDRIAHQCVVKATARLINCLTPGTMLEASAYSSN